MDQNQLYENQFVEFALHHPELNSIPLSTIPIENQTIIGIRNLPYDLGPSISLAGNTPLHLRDDKIEIYRAFDQSVVPDHTGVDTVWWQCAHMAELGSKVWEISSNGPMFRLVPEEKRFGRLEFGMVWAVREGFLINQDLLQFPHKSFITLAPSTPRVFHKLGKFYNQTNFTDSEWVYSLIQKIELENFVLIDPNYYLIYQDFLADRSQPADSRNYIRNLTKVNYFDNHAKLIYLFQDILLKNFLTTRIINALKIYVMMPFEAPEKDFYHDYIDLGE